MAWLKVDERFFDSKVGLLGPVASVVYLRSVGYCMTHIVDDLPAVIVDQVWTRLYGEHEVKEAIAALIKCGAFTRTETGDYSIEHVWIEEQVYIEPPTTWGAAETIAQHRRYGERICRLCGSTEQLEVDHIIPRSRGGQSYPSNLQTLCKRCNMSKGSRVPWGQFLASKGK